MFGEDREQFVGRRNLAFLGAAVGVAARELVVQDREAPTARRGARGDEAAAEVRLRVRACEPVGELAIDGWHFLEGELAHVGPLGAEAAW